jgi:Cys-tRNA(Pro)/Cys-tRNA(Cys) deacylase
MAKETKTNAARLLERAKIPFELVPYPVDEEHLEAQHIADCLGEDINRVFKTIVLHGDRKGYFVCVVPGNAEIDLKKAAKAIGDKKVDLIHVKELLPLTGYVRGGCSPVGMKKPFPTFFHTTALNFDTIYVSAGMRGLQFSVNPQKLIDYVRAQVVDIIKDNETEDE